MSTPALLSTLSTLDLDNEALRRFFRNLFSYLPPQHFPAGWFCSPDTDDEAKRSYLAAIFPDSASFANYVAGGDEAKRLVDEALAMAGVDNERAKVAALGYLQDRNTASLFA